MSKEVVIAEIKWLDKPEDHDYDAAADYLELTHTHVQAKALAAKLKAAPVQAKKAKDILRASRLPLLEAHDPHVAKDSVKIEKDKELSPILLVRTLDGVIVADGYHRVCAVYHYNYDADIPCKLV